GVETCIKAGTRLFVGRPGGVLALDLPLKASATPVWQVKVEGTPASLLAANGRLFAVTREGRLYCFGANKGVPQTLREPTGPPPSADAAKALLDATKVRGGYCLVWGVGTGKLATALAVSGLRVMVLEADAAKANAFRRELSGVGLYGEKVAVLIGSPKDLELPPYLASLIVSEDLAGARIEPAGR